MARRLGPDQADRLVYREAGGALRSAPGDPAVVYSDAAGTVLADIATYDGTGTPGATIAGSALTVDANTELPEFWFPDGVETLYVSVKGGAVTPIRTRLNERIDDLEAGTGGVPSSRQVIAGTGLTGGGSLAADRTFAVAYGTSSGTAAQGNDSRITGAVQASTATTKGDLLAATGSAAVTRVGVGSNDQVLTADSSTATGLKWAAAPSGSGIPATLIDAKGDLIAGSAADTAARLAVGTNGQVLTADSTQSTGIKWATPSGGGGAATDPRANLLYVAASNAPADEIARADYVCDGTADNAQIASAITAAKADGSRIRLSPGIFNQAAFNEITGPNDVDADSVDVYFEGAGPARTRLVAASGLACSLRVSQVARVHIRDIGFEIIGATHGIQSVATNNSTAGYRSFWMSSFKNLEFIGDWSTHTGYAMHLESPFRSVFENIEGNGIGNGIRMFSSDDHFNPGDCQLTRCFMDLTGNTKFGFKIESTVADGNMNQIEFSMCEAIASGTGCTGIYLGGTGPVTHTKWHGINLEQFDTLVNFNNGFGNTVDLNYVECRNVTGLSAFTFGTNSSGNDIERVGFMYAPVNINLFSKAGGTATYPNTAKCVNLFGDGGTVSLGFTGPANTPGTDTLLRKRINNSGGTASGTNVNVNPGAVNF